MTSALHYQTTHSSRVSAGVRPFGLSCAPDVPPRPEGEQAAAHLVTIGHTGAKEVQPPVGAGVPVVVTATPRGRSISGGEHMSVADSRRQDPPDQGAPSQVAAGACCTTWHD